MITIQASINSNGAGYKRLRVPMRHRDHFEGVREIKVYYQGAYHLFDPRQALFSDYGEIDDDIFLEISENNYCHVKLKVIIENGVAKINIL